VCIAEYSWEAAGIVGSEVSELVGPQPATTPQFSYLEQNNLQGVNCQTVAGRSPTSSLKELALWVDHTRYYTEHCGATCTTGEPAYKLSMHRALKGKLVLMTWLGPAQLLFGIRAGRGPTSSEAPAYHSLPWCESAYRKKMFVVAGFSVLLGMHPSVVGTFRCSLVVLVALKIGPSPVGCDTD